MAITADHIRDKLIKELAAVHVVGFWLLFVLHVVLAERHTQNPIQKLLNYMLATVLC